MAKEFANPVSGRPPLCTPSLLCMPVQVTASGSAEGGSCARRLIVKMSLRDFQAHKHTDSVIGMHGRILSHVQAFTVPHSTVLRQYCAEPSHMSR